MVLDRAGKTARCSFNVTIEDNEALEGTDIDCNITDYNKPGWHFHPYYASSTCPLDFKAIVEASGCPASITAIAMEGSSVRELQWCQQVGESYLQWNYHYCYGHTSHYGHQCSQKLFPTESDGFL